MEESDFQICSFLWVDSNKEHELLVSKKSRSDVQHHNHTEILGNFLNICSSTSVQGFSFYQFCNNFVEYFIVFSSSNIYLHF